MKVLPLAAIGLMLLTLALPQVGAAPATVNVVIPQGAANPSNPPGYSPDSITVVVGVNNTVSWMNNDTLASHTVTSSSVPTGASSFNSGNMPLHAVFTYTFTTPGTYKYLCTYHSWMTGSVLVIAGTPSPEFPASSLAIILFAVIAVALVLTPRVRQVVLPSSAKP